MKVIKKTVLQVDYKDLDSAIIEFLKSKGYPSKYNYSCIGENGWNNYESHIFIIDEPSGEKFEVEDFEYLSTDQIMDWMCADGLIEPGEYLIEIFW